MAIIRLDRAPPASFPMKNQNTKKKITTQIGWRSWIELIYSSTPRGPFTLFYRLLQKKKKPQTCKVSSKSLVITKEAFVAHYS